MGINGLHPLVFRGFSGAVAIHRDLHGTLKLFFDEVGLANSQPSKIGAFGRSFASPSGMGRDPALDQRDLGVLQARSWLKLIARFPGGICRSA